MESRSGSGVDGATAIADAGDEAADARKMVLVAGGRDAGAGAEGGTGAAGVTPGNGGRATGTAGAADAMGADGAVGAAAVGIGRTRDAVLALGASA